MFTMLHIMLIRDAKYVSMDSCFSSRQNLGTTFY